MLAEEIRANRERLGLSISSLAKKIGHPVSDVVAWEQGKRFPTKRSCKALERLFLSKEPSD